MKKLKARTFKDQSGAAILEFALTIPVLVMAISGLIYVAETFGELISLSQVAYNSALVGAESPAGSAEDAMKARRDSMALNNLRGKFVVYNSDPGENGYFSQTANGYDSNSNVVTAKISANTKNIMNLFGWSQKIGLSVVSTILYHPMEQAALDFKKFANPSHSYDCEGNVIPQPLQGGCAEGLNGQGPEVGSGDQQGGGEQGGGMGLGLGLDGDNGSLESSPPGDNCFQLVEGGDWVCPAI